MIALSSGLALGLDVFLLLMWLTGFLFLGLCTAIYGQAAYRRAIGRGQGNSVALLLGAVPIVAFSIPILLTVLLWSGWDDQRWSPGEFVVVGLLLLVSSTVGLGAGAASLWLSARLPKHPGRPGLRPLRHRYRTWAVAVAWLTLPAALVVGFASGWSNRYVVKYVVIGGISAVMWLRYYARRHTEQVQILKPAEVSASVLLLRPFDADWQMYVGARSGQTSWADAHPQGLVTFEQFIADRMRERIGPVVALGSPRDRLPPGGATRVYLANETWQQQFRDLARHVKVIVMVPGDSDNISVELQAIASNGLRPRFVVVTPPQLRPRPYALMQQVGKRYLALESRLISRRPTWSGFAARLRDTGYWRVPDDPGPGAVLAFNASGETTIIARNLADPAAIVTAIADSVGV